MSIPELRKRKYPEKILLGSLAGSGTLGLLIPPSIILIIYGVTVQESIAKLFIAGIIPGIMIALIFMSYVIIWSLINKKSMPKIIEGGIRSPKVPEPARLPNKIFSGYFLFLSSGIDILPTVATVAAEEPEIAAKSAQPTTFT